MVKGLLWPEIDVNARQKIEGIDYDRAGKIHSP